MEPIRSSCVVPPSSARSIRAFDSEIIVHLSGAETGGKYTMFTSITPPGGGPPPHVHRNEDEWFFVLSGRAEFLVDGRWMDVPVGGVVFTPRGVVHTFRNVGDTSLCMLAHTAPAGFEDFYARCAEVFARPGPPDMVRISRIAAEHGIEFA